MCQLAAVRQGARGAAGMRPAACVAGHVPAVLAAPTWWSEYSAAVAAGPTRWRAVDETRRAAFDRRLMLAGEVEVVRAERRQAGSRGRASGADASFRVKCQCRASAGGIQPYWGAAQPVRAGAGRTGWMLFVVSIAAGTVRRADVRTRTNQAHGTCIARAPACGVGGGGGAGVCRRRSAARRQCRRACRECGPMPPAASRGPRSTLDTRPCDPPTIRARAPELSATATPSGELHTTRWPSRLPTTTTTTAADTASSAPCSPLCSVLLPVLPPRLRVSPRVLPPAPSPSPATPPVSLP